MRVVEHWWNGHWGKWNRRVVKLRATDGGAWEVYAMAWDKERVLVYADESAAREQVELLLSEHGPWKKLTVR
jgi:hypothetical protein